MRNLKIVWILLAIAIQARAQEDSVKVLDEVKVEARMREVASTAPLHVIRAGDMARLGITDMADALHRIPGVMLRDYGGAGGMKTVSVRGFGAEHTGVVYDGTMLSECQSGEIDLSRYSLNNVGSLALTIGDNDDIFIPARQASSPAVLTIESLGGIPIDRHPHMEAQVQWGSFGFICPFVRYTRQVAKELAITASAEYTYAENDYPFTLRNVTLTTHEHRTHSRMNSAHGEVAMLWNPTPRSTFRAKAYYYDNDRQLPGQVRYYTSASGETLHDRNAFAQAQWTGRDASGNLSIRLNGKFNWAASDYQDRLMPNGVRDACYWQREYYASACVLFVPTTRWAFDYSADYAFNNLSSSLSTAIRPYRNTILQSLTAKYTLPRLTVMARLLHSLYYNDAKDGPGARNMKRLSPSLSLSLKLLADEELFLRASYKNIFRTPTFNESYYYHFGSTDLDPETTDQYDLGITWNHHWRDRLSTTLIADGYLNHVRDKIVAVPYNMFIWTNVNVGKAEGQGVELTAKSSYKPADHHTITLGTSWSYRRIANRTDRSSQYYGYQIAYQPLHTGSVSLGWENPWANIAIHGTGMSGRWANNNHYEGTRVPGYWETGATMWRDFKWKKQAATVRLDLMNLLDKQYEIVAHYPMPGINWKLSLNYKF